MLVEKFQIFPLRGATEHSLKKPKIALERHQMVKINF